MPTRSVRVWACIGPRGRVVYASTRRIVCSAVLMDEAMRHGYSAPIDSRTEIVRAMRRAGWHVRPLTPAEVKP